jgi:hypothetical protein
MRAICVVPLLQHDWTLEGRVAALPSVSHRFVPGGFAQGLASSYSGSS